MNLQVMGHHIEVTPAIRDYLTSKLDRLTRRFDHMIDVNVILSIEREHRKVEASVHVRGRDLFAESQDTDMYAAIDALIDKLDRQIVKHKEKRVQPRVDGSVKRSAAE
ncbi:MAG: ribosome-associated translation inhibitor RaiA [Burkholderiales bacterium]|nr:ribosome-associated translation inhibitor RaiA [Burkholderiales bacterium]